VRVPLMRTRWGGIVGLPDPQPNVWHVVSVIVAEAAVDSGRGADDLLVPGDQVRDNDGRIVGCRGLCRAVASSPALAGQRGRKVAMAIHRRLDPEAENCRPDPDALAVEAEYMVAAFDRWVAETTRLRIEGGWSYNAREMHGDLRSTLTSLCRTTIAEVLADEKLGAEQARREVLSRLLAVIGTDAFDLPPGRSGERYSAGFAVETRVHLVSDATEAP